MAVESAETPCLLLDEQRLTRNLEAMAGRAAQLGVSLRPHVKTSKSPYLVLQALGGKPGPITVSTLYEAEQFLAAGFTDIIYSVGMTPSKAAAAAALLSRGADLKILVDTPGTAAAVAAAFREIGARCKMLIEIDCDGHRSGAAPNGRGLIEIANSATAGGLEFAGVLTHAGASYDCRSHDAIAAMAEQERSAVVGAAARLRDAGFACPIVSVGSTPTARFARALDGVTEMRAGAYMFNDLTMVGLGVASLDDVAISVLTTIVGHRPDRGWIITDAGWAALSADPGTVVAGTAPTFGLVCDADTAVPVDDLVVIGTNQEHGIVASRNGGPLDLTRFPVGGRLRILPNHACATANSHDRYQLVDAVGAPLQKVERWRGW